LDDIAATLDDVATMTNVAAHKATAIVGDDLSINAEQVAGVKAERELPVVWGVAKGSMRNKAILVPSALAISAIAPWLITPILMVGGAYLCYEGFEKVVHACMPGHDAPDKPARPLTPAQFEQQKIKAAVRTDLILSGEIVVITLGGIASATLLKQLLVLSFVSVLMTVGVYGSVALLVKADDLGLYLIRRSRAFNGVAAACLSLVGRALLTFAAKLMRLLAVAGTVAMFAVGGGILLHGIPGAEVLARVASDSAQDIAHVGAALSTAVRIGIDILVGVTAGALTLLGVSAVEKVRAR
jgi:hypothetical protein